MRNEDYFGYDFAANGTTGARVPFYGLVEPVVRLAEAAAAAAIDAYGAIERFAAAARRRRLIAQTIAELSELDDRMLRDIGIERDQVRAVAEAVVDNPRFSLRDLPR